MTSHPHENPHHPHRLLAVLLFVFVAALGLRSAHVSETWRHVRAGAKILADGAIPRVDSFSYTVAGKAWSTDSWLADVAFCLIDRYAGPGGLAALKAVALAGAFALLVPLNHSNPLIAAGLLALAAFGAGAGFTETPLFLDFIALAILIRMLRPHRRFSWVRSALVVAVQLAWANAHGMAALLGVWLVFLKTVKTSLRGEGVKYWIVLGLSGVAMFATPEGPGALPNLLDPGLAPALEGPSLWTLIYAGFAVAAAWAAWVCLQQEFFLSMTAATLLALSLVAPTLRPLFLLAACPVVALALGHFMKPKRVTWPAVGIWTTGLGGLLALHLGYVHEPLGGKGYGAAGLEGAAHFLHSNGVRGRMFNEPESGDALLAWSDRPVFVDSRAELYGRAFINDAALWPLRWKALDSVYRFDYAVVLNRRSGAPAQIIDEQPDWRLVYADDAALIYLKTTGVNGWLAPAAADWGFSPNRVFPDALDPLLRQPRQASRVLERLDAWMVQAPDSVQALLWKAYALDRMGLAEKASRLLALARERPRLKRDPELQACLAYVLERQGKRDEAMRLYRRAALRARMKGDKALEAAARERLSAAGAAPRPADKIKP